uniref:NADH-ubiquinone oxidoreductase chain 2 n=1 Tax=Stegana multicardua TaxID=1127704 RepID=K4F3A1_9MUSC|nr:NADH dehydrogenase subunit 2 [Stegana multicardua]
MFNNLSKIMFISIMMLGSLVTISSNSWLSAWMGLEINLLSFIPLMSDNNDLMSTEASLKYFLVQAMASSILLFSVILLMMSMKIMLMNSYINMIILSSLMLKLGMAPFHFWFPNIMENLSWMNCLLLLTWQKIAPIMLISHLYMNMKNLLFISIILSVIIGSLGGLNQSSLRKLMTFSSINHMGWMLMALYINELIWLIYFMIYMFLSFMLIFMFNIFKIFHINQMFSVIFNSKILKFILLMNFLSLGGLPPFLGFLPKWLIIQELSMNNEYFMIFILMMFSLITLYFYLRICYSSFMLNYFENNWMNKMYLNSKNYMIMLIMSFFSLFSLIFISIMYFML